MNLTTRNDVAHTGADADRKESASLLAGCERRLMVPVIEHTPAWLESHHLTLLTLVWSALVLVAGALARSDSRWLWALSGLIAAQYVTDAIDGKVGKVRNAGLVKWGYYMDHLLDYVFLCSILLSYSMLLPDNLQYLMTLVLAVSGAFMVNAFLARTVTGVLTISYLRLGPIEMRLVFIGINALLATVGTASMVAVVPYVLIVSLGVLGALVYQTQRRLWMIDKAGAAKDTLPALLRVALFLGAFSVISPALYGSGNVQATPPPATQAPAVVPTGSARIWAGRNEEFENYLRTAVIDRFETITVGVTHPRRAYFKPGGLVASAAWKPIKPGRPQGYWESYKSEIAAYELDKLLGLDMVPPAVERKEGRETAAAILWLSPVHPWREMEEKPKPPKWDRQAIRLKMFDNLIGNPDRNAGNLLIDDDWNLFLIDHSRAFVETEELRTIMEHIDREMWAKFQALDSKTLTAALGKWLSKDQIHALLTRRNAMKKTISDLVKKYGESEIFR